MKIALSNDHGGTQLKVIISDYLKKLKYEIINLGTDSIVPVDYPDYAYKVAQLFKKECIDFGVLVCGSGIGISIAANRYSHIRAALCNDVKSCELSRLHNDANILVLGGRVIEHNTALQCVDKFLSTKFEGGRHIKRIDKLSNPPLL